MSSDVVAQAEELFGTLDEYLINLAEGLSQAQEELGQLSAAGAPGRQFTYYVPRLEFELRMDLRVETTSSGPAGKVLKMRPVRTVDVARTQSNTEIVSIIRGSFVAVPANEGLPVTLLEARVGVGEQGSPRVVARVKNAAGEPLPGVEVEFNLDRKATEKLSGKGPLKETDVTVAVVKTDAAGEASTLLRIASAEQAHTLVLTVDAGGRTALLAYEVRR